MGPIRVARARAEKWSVNQKCSAECELRTCVDVMNVKFGEAASKGER